MCLSSNTTFYGKLISSLESLIIFAERFKVASVPFSIADFFYLETLGGNKFVYSNNKLLSFNIKSINPIQNYIHIIEFYACFL